MPSSPIPRRELISNSVGDPEQREWRQPWTHLIGSMLLPGIAAFLAMQVVGPMRQSPTVIILELLAGIGWLALCWQYVWIRSLRIDSAQWQISTGVFRLLWPARRWKHFPISDVIAVECREWDWRRHRITRISIRLKNKDRIFIEEDRNGESMSLFAAELAELLHVPLVSSEDTQD